MTWQKTKDGYQLENTAILTKLDGTWILVLKNSTHELGKKASFDEAENIIRRAS